MSLLQMIAVRTVVMASSFLLISCAGLEAYQIQEMPVSDQYRTALKSTNSPVPVKMFQPQHRKRQLNNGTTGCVTVTFDVLTNGTPANMVVTKSFPKGEFDEQALKALRLWRFEPRESAACLILPFVFIALAGPPGFMVDPTAASYCSK